jgi:hypothetical protein
MNIFKPRSHTTIYTRVGDMVNPEKYLQFFMTVAWARGCVTRRALVELFMKKFSLDKAKAGDAVKSTARKLRRRGIITLKGPGVYCWNVPAAAKTGPAKTPPEPGPPEPQTITLDLESLG